MNIPLSVLLYALIALALAQTTAAVRPRLRKLYLACLSLSAAWHVLLAMGMAPNGGMSFIGGSFQVATLIILAVSLDGYQFLAIFTDFSKDGWLQSLVPHEKVPASAPPAAAVPPPVIQEVSPDTMQELPPVSTADLTALPSRSHRKHNDDDDSEDVDSISPVRNFMPSIKVVR